MTIEHLKDALKFKKDEFYTSMCDIEKEMEIYLNYNKDLFKGKTVLLPCDDPEKSNFTRFFAREFSRLGLKKVISTSFSGENSEGSRIIAEDDSLFAEQINELFGNCSENRGKISILTKDQKFDENNIPWQYLEGDGDFRSEEITKIRDNVDFVITNPPFSLFRQFVSWLKESNVLYSVMGNMNSVGRKSILRLFIEGEMWYGGSIRGSDREFLVPDDYPLTASCSRVDGDNRYVKVKGVRWFTNIEYGKRRDPLDTVSMEENLNSNKKIIQNINSYKKLDNYEAIEVPTVSGIPSDYDGLMAVPISFLDKHDPEQFDLIGGTQGVGPDWIKRPIQEGGYSCAKINGKNLYQRILIKRR